MYKKVLRKFFSITFPVWQALGFSVVPNYFYSPVPDVATLKDQLWQKKSSLVGIDMNEQGQITTLSTFSNIFKKEYEALQKYLENTEFGPVDAEVLYCMVRHYKPKRIVEVGSGYSTQIMLTAIRKNKEESGLFCQLTSIDPYPKQFVKDIKDKFFTLIEKEVQDVPLETFTVLGKNDILFIDSSHVLKTGSDVQYEYLEVLPNISSGVVVHIHDIFFPNEYPKAWIKNDHTFFNEQYIFQAFLTYSSAFAVLWGANFMHTTHSELLKNAFASYNANVTSPGSFWIQRR